MKKEVSFLKVRLFTATVNQSNAAIPEDQIKVFSIDKKRAALEQIKSKLATQVEDISAFASGMIRPVEPHKVSWMGGDFLIQIQFLNGAKLQVQNTAAVNITIYDTRKKKKFTKDFSIGLNKGKLATIRRDKTAIIIAIYPELESEKRSVTYHSEFRFEDFTILSEDSSWKELEYIDDEITFHNAKAIIPIKDEHLTLIGEKIVYQKKKNKLIGVAISLFKSTNQEYDKKLIEAKKVVIPLSDPLKFRKIK